MFYLETVSRGAPKKNPPARCAFLNGGLGKGKGNLWQRLDRSQPLRIIFPRFGKQGGSRKGGAVRAEGPLEKKNEFCIWRIFWTWFFWGCHTWDIYDDIIWCMYLIWFGINLLYEYIYNLYIYIYRIIWGFTCQARQISALPCRQYEFSSTVGFSAVKCHGIMVDTLWQWNMASWKIPYMNRGS